MAGQHTKYVYSWRALLVAIMHIHKHNIWTPVVREELDLQIEEENSSNPRAINVVRSGLVLATCHVKLQELYGSF